MQGIGIIGAGWFAGEHAKAIAQIPNVRLLGVCSAQLEAAQNFAAAHGGKAYPNPELMLANPHITAVLIATPHHQHANMAILAAQAGKHILLEKPMAHTLEQCQAILQQVEQAGVRLMVGHLPHFEQPMMLAKNLLQQGAIGQPVLGQSTFAKYWMEPNRRDWHLHPDSGGGMLLTAGIHALDRLLWLMDTPVISVAAQLGAYFHPQQADDGGILFLRMQGGTAGLVSSIGYAHGAPSFALELSGTQGRLRLDAQGVWLGHHGQWRLQPLVLETDWPLSPLVRQWQEFVQSIEQNQTPAVSGGYAMQVMRVIFAAEQSSVSLQEVPLYLTS